MKTLGGKTSLKCVSYCRCVSGSSCLCCERSVNFKLSWVFVFSFFLFALRGLKESNLTSRKVVCVCFPVHSCSCGMCESRWTGSAWKRQWLKCSVIGMSDRPALLQSPETTSSRTATNIWVHKILGLYRRDYLLPAKYPGPYSFFTLNMCNHII